MKEYKLGRIIIMGDDLWHKSPSNTLMPKMDLRTAENLIKEIPSVWVWRLPTIEEFKFLQEYSDMGILNFSRDAYWSSDIIEGSSNRYAYYLKGKRYGGIPIDQRLSVRLVRDI